MDKRGPAFAVVTLGGIGLVPRAPGTVGAIGALPFAVAIQWAGGPLALLVAALGLYAIGFWACRAVLTNSTDDDPGCVVIDEAVGLWIALIPAGLDWRLLFAGFLLFRLLDIAKPWPISWLERNIPGAHGVMLDDVLAGALAVPVVLWLRIWMGG